MAQYRKTLLTSLAGVLGEVDPEQYVPDVQAAIATASAAGVAAGPTTAGGLELAVAPSSGPITRAAPLSSSGVVAPQVHFAFDAGPPHEAAAVFASRQRSQFTGTEIQSLVRLWLARARFLLRLRGASKAIRPVQSKLATACEVCKKAGKEAGLAVNPVFTLSRLASEFRRQREMSPLWNMEMWKNFFEKFTPTCTVCTECAVKYWERNVDIPVDEPRMQRLRLSSKSAVHLLRESPYGVTATVDQKENPFLKKWQAIAERLHKGEDWRDFLPLLGYSAEAESAHLMQAENKKVVLSSDDDSDTEAKRTALRTPVIVTPQTVRLVKLWMTMARRNVKYPNIRDLTMRKAMEEIGREREEKRRREEERYEQIEAAKRQHRRDTQGF
jgi:hypothetical protein